MANFTKFFRNGKTFSAYCRMRYGQSKAIWEDTTLWEKTGIYSIGFDEATADEKFGNRQNGLNNLKPAHREAAFDEENYAERKMEEMAAYIHSGAGLQAYYEDQEAGYTY